MLKIQNAILLVIAALSLAGCASTGRPVYSPPAAGPKATIEGGKANFFKFFTAGDSHVVILEVDGAYIPPSFWTGSCTSIEVSPGARKITVLITGNYAQAQDTVEIAALPGMTYQIEARKLGIAFDIIVTEYSESASTGKVVLTKRVNGMASPGPTYVPIMIPVN